jgi:phosphomevalonate kinase
MKSRRWTAPGNLLIVGEYLVTEEGGPGISVAAGGRAVLNVGRAPELKMTGLREGAEISDDSLQRSVCGSYRKIKGMGSLPAAVISVDTGVFFDKKAGKKGFGSSAAAALLFACGLADAEIMAHFDGNTAGAGVVDQDLVVRIALDAHRSWQGGRGSGYDVLSSAGGGAGLFIGGGDPVRSAIPWPDYVNAWIISGSKPVSSPGAVGIYQRWKAERGKNRSGLPVLNEMTVSIRRTASLLTAGAGAAELLENIHHLACLGADLGRELGVPALPDLPLAFSSGGKPWYRPGRSAAKCLGAGDEMALLLAVPDGLSQKEQSALDRLEDEGRVAPLIFESHGLQMEKER